MSLLYLNDFVGSCALLPSALYFVLLSLGIIRNHDAAKRMAWPELILDFVNPNFKQVWESLPGTLRRCHRILKLGGAVVVHCNSGHHRAPQVAACLLAGLRGISYEDAAACCQIVLFVFFEFAWSCGIRFALVCVSPSCVISGT